LGSALLSQSRGVSVQPPARITTDASSVVRSPVAVSRQVTAFARVTPPTVVVCTWVANALAISVTALPDGAQEPATPAVSAIGM
jgi:hypothetical protein